MDLDFICKRTFSFFTFYFYDQIFLTCDWKVDLSSVIGFRSVIDWVEEEWVIKAKTEHYWDKMNVSSLRFRGIHETIRRVSVYFSRRKRGN